MQVCMELLNFVTSEQRIHAFLSTIDLSRQPVQWCSSGPTASFHTGTLRLSGIAVNERARSGGALYQRFVDTMAGHVAELGGK